MPSTEIKRDFSARLHQVCDEKDLPRERGRNTALAKQFQVTPNAARKWLLGLGMPELDQAIEIARWGEVNVEWLLTGRGPMRGNLIDTKALVIDEALRSLGPEYRHQALDHLKYVLERSRSWIRAGKVDEFQTAIDQYERDLTKAPKGH